MSRFLETLKSSFSVFVQHPKFILPKLFIAFLYSIMILLTADVAVSAFTEPSQEVLANSLVLLFVLIVLNVLDVFISSMYPFMVKDVMRKNGVVSISKSFKEALSRAKVIMPSVLSVEFGFLVLSFILSVPLALLILSESDYTIIFSLLYVLLILAAVFFFFLLYPITAFENVSILESFRRSIRLALKNRADFAKATLLSFALSALSIGIGFSLEIFPQNEGTALFWLAFIIVRLLTAYVYSYLYVLNPMFYFNYVAAGKSGGKK
ncbi:MAG TPA: hypothetical protein VFF09_05655 [archaeon]|nr:hypothetical protein [archaeon]